MLTNKKPERLYEFGSFRLVVSEHQLLRSSEVVPLSPKVFDTLLVLVENSGHIVSKEKLITAVWPDTFVEDSSLTQNISRVRKALGESAEERFIETVPKRGYRFVAPVRVLNEPSTDETSKEENINGHPSTLNEFEAEDVERANIGESRLQFEDSQPASVLTNTTIAPPPRFSFSLRFAALIVAILVGLAGAGYVWKTLMGGKASLISAPVEKRIRSVAILPLRSLGNENDDGYLGLGMADALILKLSRFRQVNVLPLSTVFRYTGREYDLFTVGRELGAQAVLDGTVQRAGDRFRVSVMLVDVANGRTIWSEKFDEPFTDIFALQDAISQRVAESLSIRLSEEEKTRLSKRFTENLEAYHSYLIGLHFWNKRTKDALLRAIDFFQQAISHDPHYAQAYAGLADSYTLIAYYGYDKSIAEIYGKARAMALKAIEHDETLAEPYATLGMLSAVTEGNPAKARELYGRALELNPNYGAVYIRCAWISLNLGNPARALEEMKRGHELDPISPFTNTALSQMLYYQRHYDEAIKFSRKALELEPKTFLAQYILSLSYEQKGMYQEAIEEAGKINGTAANSAGKSDALEVMGYIYARAGRKDEARKILSKLNEKRRQNPPDVSPLNIAMMYEGLGERDKAFEWVNKFLASEPFLPIIFRFDPRSEALRADSKYDELLRARGLK